MSLVQLLLLTLWSFAHINAICIAERYEPIVLHGNDFNPTCPSAIKSQMALDKIDAETDSLLDSIIHNLNQNFGCKGVGWTNVAYFNMDNPSHHCPQAWNEITHNLHRACGRKSSGCQSVVFNTSGRKYNEVCGRVIAYQYGHPDGFNTRVLPLDSFYIDGVSLTRGNPQQHVWSFVMGQDQTSKTPWVCPCVDDQLIVVPGFVGDNYFCDAALTHYDSRAPNVVHTDNPLWDGENCGEAPNCCNHNSWFNATLPTATNDSFEVRICLNESPNVADALIKLLDLYVK